VERVAREGKETKLGHRIKVESDEGEIRDRRRSQVESRNVPARAAHGTCCFPPMETATKGRRKATPKSTQAQEAINSGHGGRKSLKITMSTTDTHDRKGGWRRDGEAISPASVSERSGSSCQPSVSPHWRIQPWKNHHHYYTPSTTPLLSALAILATVSRFLIDRRSSEWTIDACSSVCERD